MSSENGDSGITYEEFLLIHQAQLKSSSVPELYWETLFIKLKNEVFDAGLKFQIQCVEVDTDSDDEEEAEESHSWQVVVNHEDGIKCTDKENIFLIDHAWTYRLHEARQYLTQVPGLLDRMAALMEVPSEGREVKDVQDGVLTKMWKYNQTYSVANYKLGTEERLPIWYVMDEFGSRIQHSDTPTFKLVPFMYGQKTAFTIMWPLQDLEDGDEVTRDFVGRSYSEDIREAMLLPWIPADFTNKDFQLQEPQDAFFTEHTMNESDYATDADVSTFPKDRKLKVFLEYPDSPELTDERFELVDTGEKADIIWICKHFKDFKSLYSEGRCRIINQFPSENCITVKDLLAVVSRRGGKIDPVTLQATPKWFPETFNLNTELLQFISYFQNREKKGLPNVWIIKPWNLSNSADIYVSDKLDQIIRMKDTDTPRIACRYVTDVVTLRREDISANVKIDIRFLVFLASVNPLKLYAYRPLSVRRAHKEYELRDFDDLLKHLTYINFYKFNVYRPGMYSEEFIKQFESEYPSIPWSSVEDKIHVMMKELFISATSKPPPAGIGHFPFSRALYGLDLVLEWVTDENGERTVQPVLCEVNFTPDYTSWRDNFPNMLNDAFSALFFDDIEGREETVKQLIP